MDHVGSFIYFILIYGCMAKEEVSHCLYSTLPITSWPARFLPTHFQAKSHKLILLPECPWICNRPHGPDNIGFLQLSRIISPCIHWLALFFLFKSIILLSMQFMKNSQKSAFVAVRFMSNAAAKPKKQPKLPRYSPQNQQILDDMMIPGPALRFFKTKKERRRPDGDNLVCILVS